MARREISAFWDRHTRNDINDNFEELFDKYHNFYVEVTKDIIDDLMANSSMQFREPVNSQSDLDDVTDLKNGDTIFVIDSGKWFRWDGNNFVEVAKTSTSEFTSLQGAFNDLQDAFNDLKDSTNSALSSMVYVEESGSNSNGNFIRYSDGTQVCWGRPFSQNVTTKTGDLYRSTEREWNYPKPFVDNNVHISVTVSSYARWGDIQGNPTKDSANIVQVSSVESDLNISSYCYAFGRWK